MLCDLLQGNSSKVRGCGELACPVDCSMKDLKAAQRRAWSCRTSSKQRKDWTDWTSCTPYCKGSQSRTRSSSDVILQSATWWFAPFLELCQVFLLTPRMAEKLAAKRPWL